MSVQKYIIKKGSSNFTVFPNKVLQELTNYSALGLYVYISSLPHGWEFNKVQLRQHGNVGKNTLNALLKILEVQGLVILNQVRGSNGRFEHFELEVLDGTSFKNSNLKKEVQPFTEKPSTVHRLPVNSRYKENTDKVNIKHKEYISCSSGDERVHEFTSFDNFWSFYPRKQNKKNAKEIWDKKNIQSCEQLIIEDLKYRREHEWKNKAANYIPMPSTYLNGRRWEDHRLESSGNSRGNGMGVGGALNYVLHEMGGSL